MKTYRLQRSFCKSLFSGRVNQETIFPYPKMDATEGEVVRILMESLSSFAKEKIRSATIDNEGVIPQDVVKGLAELGVLGMSVPQEYGGAGFSNSAYNRVFEEISKIDSSVAATMAAHQSIGLKAILHYGSDEQKATYLPKLASGQWLAAFALTEPGARIGCKWYQDTGRPLKGQKSLYPMNPTPAVRR
jgi:acyl-CoA dehydrogenase family protein 9